MKKTFCTLFAAFLLTLTAAAAELPFFSGYAGILGNTSNKQDTKNFNPELNNKIFFAGQFDFDGKVFVRSELSVNTDNIFKTGLFKDTQASYKINELSFTWHQTSNSSSHFISGFIGNYEPIGSDVFLRRQFGIQSITSAATESFNGLCNSAVYPFYGLGGSYVIHFENPSALGLYVYANESEKIQQKFINTDLRFACGFSTLALDFSMGAAFPIEKEIAETGSDAILVVRTLTLHSGLTMLWGNRNRFSLFMQTGFSNLIYDPQAEKKFSINSDDMYLLVEPRFVTQYFSFNFSLYSIPQDCIDDMIFLHDTLGANLNFYNDHFAIQGINLTCGLLATFSLPEKNFMDAIDLIKSPADFLEWEKNLYITPYTALPLLNGTLKGTISINALGIGKKGFGAVSASLGYKTQL